MRYLILSAIAIINLILTGAVFPNINIAGIHPDVIICTMASIVIMEKSMMGAIVGLVCGLALDIMFSGAIGFYTIPLFLTGSLLYFAVSRFQFFNKFLLPGIFAMGAYLVKELFCAIIVYMLGIRFSLGHMFVRYILMEALITGVFMLLIHMLLRRLYRTSSLKPHYVEDIKKLL